MAFVGSDQSINGAKYFIMISNERIGSRFIDMYADRDRPESRRALADLFWRTLLAAVFLTVVLAIAYGIFTLSSILHDASVSGAVGAESSQPIPSFNRAQLQETLDGFRARQGKFEALKASAPSVSDPSK